MSIKEAALKLASVRINDYKTYRENESDDPRAMVYFAAKQNLWEYIKKLIKEDMK